MVLKLQNILLLLLVFQLAFTSLYLFTKKNGSTAGNYLLGTFFLCLGLSLGDNLLLYTDVWDIFPQGAVLTGAFPLLYGPLLFLYTQSSVYSSFKTNINRTIHFAPFLALFVISFIAFQLQPLPVKLYVVSSIKNHKIPPYFYAGALIMTLHFFSYALLSFRLINRYRDAALNNFSDDRKTNLKWLSNTILFFLVLFMLSLFSNVFQIASWPALYTACLTAIILLLFYFINQVIFKSLHNVAFLKWDDDAVTNDLKRPSVRKDLPDKSADLMKLSAFMKAHKPYLNPDLTIEKLAIDMSMHPKELSQLINVYLDQNFFDFVNRYRIQEAQEIISCADKKLTILEVLYSTGFNSKSSFNTLFKKYTGLTPSEFRAAAPSKAE